jgi:hypothetical protein
MRDEVGRSALYEKAKAVVDADEGFRAPKLGLAIAELRDELAAIDEALEHLDVLRRA